MSLRTIWHYAWRVAFMFLIFVALRKGWLSYLQVFCLGGIFACIGYAILHWDDNKRNEGE